jgi:hypothetical protein
MPVQVKSYTQKQLAFQYAKEHGSSVYKTSWGDREGETHISYLGQGYVHRWNPNDGSINSTEIFSTEEFVEAPAGVPEYAAHFSRYGEVWRCDYQGFRAGHSESETYYEFA